MAAPAREQRSLLGEILDWMLVPLLLLWPMSVGLTWVVAQDIAGRPYDRDLAELARAVARRVVIEPGPRRHAIVTERAPLVTVRQERDDEFPPPLVQVLGLRGELINGERNLPVPIEDLPVPGELRLRDEVLNGQPLRVAYMRLAMDLASDEMPPMVQVAETLDRRKHLATDIIKGVILPQFIILPVAVMLVWLALARGLAPLKILQRRIRRRASHDLSPIDELDGPEEVAPLVSAINDLLARLDRSIGAQKHFLVDAAHQMKTPLAGLRMQAELAQREIDAGADPQSVKRTLQQIALSSQRAAHLVNQLLAMARAEDQEMARNQQDLHFVRLAMETVSDLLPHAMDKRIDLGFEGPDPGVAQPQLLGQPLLVREMIRNLVDNALQYTPAGGTVTVRVLFDPYGQVVVLQVEDTGPGIAEAERERIFQPFYRVLGSEVDGSGLGLAIVREIVQSHGAEVQVEDAGGRPPGGPGVRFSVRFRAQAPRPARRHTAVS